MKNIKKLNFNDIFNNQEGNNIEIDKENKIMTELHNITLRKKKKENFNIEELIEQNSSKVDCIMKNNINSILMNSLIGEKNEKNKNELILGKPNKSNMKIKKLNKKDNHIFRLTSDNNFSSSNFSDVKASFKKPLTTLNKLKLNDKVIKSKFKVNVNDEDKVSSTSKDHLLTIDSNNYISKSNFNQSFINNNMKKVSRNEKILEFRKTQNFIKNSNNNSNYNSFKETDINFYKKKNEDCYFDNLLTKYSTDSKLNKSKFIPKLYFKQQKENNEIDYVKRKFVYMDILKKVDKIENKGVKDEMKDENLDILKNFPKKSNMDINSNFKQFENNYKILFQENAKKKTQKDNLFDENDLDDELIENLKKNLKIKDVEDKFHFLVDKVKLGKDKIQKHTFITSNIAKVISYTDIISKMKDSRIIQFGDNIKETYSNYSKKIGLEKEFSEKEYLTYNTHKAFSNLTKEKIQSSYLKRRMAELTHN